VCSAQGNLSIDGVDSATPGSNGRGGILPLRPEGSTWNQQLHASRTTTLTPWDGDGVAGGSIGLQLLGLVLTIPIALQGPGRLCEVSLNGQNEQVEESVPTLHSAEGESEAQAWREHGAERRTAPQKSPGSTPETGFYGDLDAEDFFQGMMQEDQQLPGALCVTIGSGTAHRNDPTGEAPDPYDSDRRSYCYLVLPPLAEDIDGTRGRGIEPGGELKGVSIPLRHSL
jgi:hypothetical protein